MTPTKSHPCSVGLHRFAVATAIATWFLLLAGALVTSNEAGLSVPDWPLSYGTWMPPMVGGIVYEHTHRMVAGLVGLLTVILAVWLWRREPRRWVRRLSLAALLAVFLQAILGGITVLYYLPTVVSVSHACLAQLFFAAVVSLALVTSPGWRWPEPPTEHAQAPRLRLLSVLASVAVFLQLLLGALLRHKALGIEAHLAGAAMATVLVGWTVAAASRASAAGSLLRQTARWLLGLFILQLVLGIAAYWARLVTREAVQPEPAMVVFTVAHVVVGALVLASSVALTFQVYRWFAPIGYRIKLSTLPEKAVS